MTKMAVEEWRRKNEKKRPGQKRQKLKRWEKREKKNDKLILLLLFISPQFRAPAATASSIINSHFQEGRERGWKGIV